ncbi:MAG: hypothetical protein JNK02_03615 [Planctomycetes bacterium]|nr:hypothetical protein [Planctomycetota bacterium]
MRDPAETPEERAPRPGRRAWIAGATAAVLVLGVWIRVLGARGDPWLDEVWSFALAREARTAWGVLTLAHDNNHLLNTLWLRVVPDGAAAWVWRAPAVACGAAFLAVVVGLARRRGPQAGLVAALVACASLPLVVYQSEARGYSALLLAAVLAWVACRAYLAAPSAGRAALFALACTAGLLSHASFLQAWAALAGWSAVRMARDSAHTAQALGRWFALHAAPLVAIGVFAALFLARMTIGGGPDRALLDVLGETVSLAVGLPRGAGFEAAAAVVVLLVLGAHVALERAAGHDAWVLLVLAVVIVPAIALAWLRPEFVAPRYFLVPLAAWLAAFAGVSARLVARGGLARVVAVVLLAAFVLGNGWKIAAFLQHGRGNWVALLQRVQERSVGPAATLATGGFDVGLLAEWAAPALRPEPRIVLVGGGLARGADWYLVQSAEERPAVAPQIELGPFAYALEAHSAFHGPSGAHWMLYRRVR